MKSRSHSLIAAQSRTKCTQDLELRGQFPTVQTALASGQHATRKSPDALEPLAERAPFTGAYANNASDLKTMILLTDILKELEKLRWLLEVRLLLQKGKEPIPKLADHNTSSRSQFAKR